MYFTRSIVLCIFGGTRVLHVSRAKFLQSTKEALPFFHFLFLFSYDFNTTHLVNVEEHQHLRYYDKESACVDQKIERKCQGPTPTTLFFLTSPPPHRTMPSGARFNERRYSCPFTRRCLFAGRRLLHRRTWPNTKNILYNTILELVLKKNEHNRYM